MMIFLLPWLLLYTLSGFITPLHAAMEESIVDLRCAHGANQIPLIVCTPSAPCTVVTCSFLVTTTSVIPGASFSEQIIVPGPSADYTSLSISGTLTANQVCASQVNAANMDSLYLSSGYYSNMYNYQILRSNASIFSTFGNELILTATDSVTTDDFGYAVDMSGDGSIVVVGAPRPLLQGNVYIYRREFNTWTLIQEFQEPIPDNNNSFGSGVAISYDASTIAIYSPNAAANLGMTYLYQYSSSADQWLLVQEILGTGSTTPALGLSATGQYLVWADNTAAPQALVYVRNDTCAGRGSVWELQQPLTPSGAGINRLGLAISSDASTIAVGALSSASIIDHVDMFTRSGSLWSLVQTLTASDAVANDQFGSSVSLSNNGQYLLVGASGNSTGRAYEFVLRGTGWNQENEFFPSGGATGFGVAVDISGDGTVGVIGSVSGTATGNAFVVLRSPDNIWTTPSMFTGHSVSATFGFSCACSADGAFMVVGSPTAVAAGTASIFRPVSALIPADTIITGSLCVNVNMIVDADVRVTGSVFVQGTVITGGVTPCLTPSDSRLKTNIKPLDPQEAFRKLQLLEPVTFSWVNPEEHPGESDPSAGLIAQDVERHFPDWIYRGLTRGKDAQLIAGQEPARLIAITPELFAYLVACVQALDESDKYKDELMRIYKNQMRGKPHRMHES